MMDYILLDEISTSIRLYESRKSMNPTDGLFSSVYQGSGMDFDDLRAYTAGDRIRDIDWKASSRSEEILVRRSTEERRHHVLFIMDTGKAMTADTPQAEMKAALAVRTMGAVGYLLNRQSADLAEMLSVKEGIDYIPFSSGNVYLQNMMNRYADAVGDGTQTVSEVLRHADERIGRHCLVFVLTDMEGVSKLNEELISSVVHRHDLFVIRIDDALLCADNSFDIFSGRYADTQFFMTPALQETEKRVRQEILDKADSLFMLQPDYDTRWELYAERMNREKCKEYLQK